MKGYEPWVTNEQLVDKYRRLASTVLDQERVAAIERAVLSLDTMKDSNELIALLAQPCGKGLE